MLKDNILSFYSDPDPEPENERVKEIKKYSWLKIHLLYPVTIMNGNVLSIFTSIATCLSMNIFTNFISFQDGNFFDLVIWIFRFMSAIIFNICVAKFSIICTILQNNAMENRNKGMPRIERLDSLLKEYNDNYAKIRKEVIRGILSLTFLVILIVIYPVGKFIFTNRDFIEQSIQSIKEYFVNIMFTK